jgi:hypothetical protein
MSQHNQRIQNGPSGAAIVTGGVAIALSAAGCVYLVSGPGLDPRKAVAVLLGGLLTGVLTVRVMGLVTERAVIADRALRAIERERDIAEYERELDARERDLAARQREWRRVEPEVRQEPRHEGRQEPRHEGRQEPVEVARSQTGCEMCGTGWVCPDHMPVLPEPEDRQEPEPEPRPERSQAHQEPVDAYGRTWAQAWLVYRDNHPEVVASWGQQNGRWPNCPGPECNLGQAQSQEWNAFEPTARQSRVAVPLPPRDGYADPGPYSSYAPVSPGRGGSNPDDWPTEVMSRYEDRPTEVIPAQS